MAKENYLHEDRAIPFSVLLKLPAGFRPLALVHTEDMLGNHREAILVLWRESPGYEQRQAYFDIETGEYLHDKLIL